MSYKNKYKFPKLHKKDKEKHPYNIQKENHYLLPPLFFDMTLQRTIGNQEVQRMFKTREILTKLFINQPRDVYEQEADRVAEQIVNMGDNEVQLKSEKTKIQKKGTSFRGESVSSQTEAKINSLKGKGRPLEPKIRDYFQPRFGVDLGDVRIHTESNADRLARAIRARAFTHGNDIVFDQGQYQPETTTGKKLIAHELTHVMQQNKNVQKIIQRQDDQHSINIENIQNGPNNDSVILEFNTLEQIELTPLDPFINNCNPGFVFSNVILESSDSFEIMESTVYPENLNENIVFISLRTSAMDEYVIIKMRWPYIADFEKQMNNRLFFQIRQLTAGEIQKELTEAVQNMSMSWQHLLLEMNAYNYETPAGIENWSLWKAIEWQMGGDQVLLNFKDNWVTVYKEIIRDIAETENIPPELLGMTAWTEVGGSPPLEDYIAFMGRNILNKLGTEADPTLTSFGNIQMQIKTAAELLNYDPDNLTSFQIYMIVYSLQDPIQNLMLAAKLLRRLIEIDWGNIAADEMTKEQVMLTSLRYSRSPGISLELLKEVLKNEPYKSESYDKMRRLFSE